MSLLSDLYEKYGAPALQTIGQDVQGIGQSLQQNVVQPAEQLFNNGVVAPIQQNVVQPFEQFASNALTPIQQFSADHRDPTAPIENTVVKPFNQFLLSPNNPYANGAGPAVLGGLKNFGNSVAPYLPASVGPGIPSLGRYLISSPAQRQDQLNQTKNSDDAVRISLNPDELSKYSPEQQDQIKQTAQSATLTPIMALTGGIEKKGAAAKSVVPKLDESPVNGSPSSSSVPAGSNTPGIIEKPAVPTISPADLPLPVAKNPQLAPDAVIRSIKNSDMLTPGADELLPQTSHEQRSLDASVTQMEELGKTNPAKLQDLAENGTADEKTSALLAMTRKAGADGDAAAQAEYAKAASAHGIDVGRGVQAFKQVDPDSAEGAAVTYQRAVNKSNNGQAGSIQETADQIKQSIENPVPLKPNDVIAAAKAAVSKTVEEASASQPSTMVIQKPVKVGEGTVKPTPEPAEDQLAKKVVTHVNDGIEAPVRNPKSELVSELFKIAKENLPPTKRAKAQSAIDRINQVFVENEENPGVYDRAKQQVIESFKDNPAAKEAIAQYEKSTAESPVIAKSTLTKAVKDEIKSRGEDLSDIVKNMPKSDQATYAQSVVDKMKEKGYSSEAAQAFLDRFKAEIETQMQVKRDAAIKQMQGSGNKYAKPTFDDKLNKLHNTGVLTNDDYRDLAAAKLGSPNLDTATMRDIADRTEHIQSLPEGREKDNARSDLYRMLGSKVQTSIGQKAATMFRANILSAFHIFGKVIPSHVINAVSEAVTDQIGGKLIDPLLSHVTGQRGMVGTVRGGSDGLKSAFNNALDLTLHGRDPHASAEQVMSGQVNMGNNWVGQALHGYVETVRRMHGFFPSIGESIASVRTLYDRAETTALNSGLKGQAKEDFIKNFVTNPPKEAVEEARYQGQRTALTNETLASKAVEGLAKGGGNGTKLFNPIVRVPAAAGTAVIDHTPVVGTAKAIIEYHLRNKEAGSVTPESQALLARGLARPVIGTAAMALGGAAAVGGSVSTRSKTPAERALKEAQGIPDNSVKVPLINKWVPQTSLGPLGGEVDMGASAYEGLQNTKRSPGSLGNSVFNAATSLGMSQLNQPILSGFNPLYEAIKNPAAFGPSFAGSLAKSVAVPGFISNFAQDNDPYKRQVATDNASESILNAIKSGIPGVSQTLPVKNTVLGEPMVATSNIGLSADQPGADSPVLQELNRLHQGGLSAMPAPLGKTISALGVLQSLTGQQQSDLQGIRGQEYVSQINSLMQSPEYQKLTDADKAEAIKKVQTIVDTQTNIKYAASNDLQQTDQGGIELNHTQQDAQYKLQAANAYQHSDGAAYHALISKLPPAQQVTVADEIRAAFGDTVYGKQDSAAAQVIKSMQPPVAGLDAGQVGAVNYVNNPSSFQNKRTFEQSNPDRNPIYDLPDEQARQVLLARSQSVDGQSTMLAKYIKDAPWYKQYAAQESAYFDAHPQPAQLDAIQNPLMSSTQKAAAAQLDQLTTPSAKSAFYNTPAGQDLQNFYKSLSQVNAQKLERMGATADQVAVAQQASAFQSQDITKAIAAIANGTAGTAAAFKSGSSSRRISAGAKRAGASLGQVSKPRGSSSTVRSISFHAPSSSKRGVIARPPSYKVSKPV